MKPTSKPRKSRLLYYLAPFHQRRKMLSATLSDELRKEYGTRSFPVRKGDIVRIMRGDFRGVEGKVVEVDYEKCRIYISGVKRERTDGAVRLIPIHPSKVMITKLDLSDKLRVKALKRRKAS